MRATTLLTLGTVFNMLVSCTPAFAERGSRSPQLIAERETLSRMATLAENFEAEYTGFFTELEKLRRGFAWNRNQRSRERAELAHGHLSLARQKWTILNRLYRESQEQDLNITRQIHNEYLDQHPTLQAFIRMKESNRFGHGYPFGVIYRSWLGLRTGHKVDTVPAQLRLNGEIAGKEVRQGDDIHVHLSSGGTIRGFIEGWSRNGDLLIHEVMPTGLMIYQKRLGTYRRLTGEDWRNIAAVDVHQPFDPPIQGAARSPFIDRLGNFSKTYFAAATYEQSARVELNPSDADLLKAAKLGAENLANLRKPISVWPLDVTAMARPQYAKVLLFDCEGELSN